MVTMAIFCLVILGVVSSYVFGLKMYEVTKAKLGASDEARRSMSIMMGEIQSSWKVRIGNGNLGNFSEMSNGVSQVGSAVQIYPSSNTNDWVRYYFDTNTFMLRRTEDGFNASDVMAHSIATNTIFSAEDSGGNVLTDNFNNRVIGVTLQIKQFRYPITQVGPGYYFDFYQLKTKITRRKLE